MVSVKPTWGSLPGDDVFRELVIARIVEPTSKADTQRVLDDLGAEPVSYKTIQRHLAMITPGGRLSPFGRIQVHYASSWIGQRGPGALARRASVVSSEMAPTASASAT